MAFDAGAIVARVEIDDSAFDRSLSRVEARLADLTRDRHVKIIADFDQSSAARMRRLFSDLDRQITNDAITRSRSGTGSILGTLMGTLSARTIPGMPTGSQAASQGLLGQTLRVVDRGGGGGDGGGGGSFVGRLFGGAAGGAAGGLLGRLFGGGAGAAGGAVASGAAGQAGQAATGIAGGIGPGILGMSAKTAAGIGLGGIGLAALPAAAGLGAGAGVLGIGVTALIATSKRLQAEAKNMLDGLMRIVAQAAQPLMKPLMDAFRQIPQFFRSIEPELRALFSAAAPLMRPLLGGLESLVRNLLPGLLSLVKAAQPAFTMFAEVMGTLGRDLGSMFQAFSTAIKPSSIVLKALLDALGGLLPVIGKVAAIFAQALAPVVVTFGAAIKALEPALTVIGRVLAQLAGAVLSDIASAFMAIARLIAAMAPGLAAFAGAFSQVFSVMENNGVFATLGNVLEKLAAPLGKLISLILVQLTPILPVLIALVTTLSNILLDLLDAGLLTIINAVTKVLTTFRFLVPLLGLAAAAWGVYALAQALALGPVTLITIAVIALIGAITLLVKHWGQVWSDIKAWSRDAWEFLTHGWGQFLIPGLTLIRLAVELVRDHWKQAWDDITGAAKTAWDFIVNDIVDPLEQVFTKNIPHYFDVAVSAISTAWDAIENAVKGPINWVIKYPIDTLVRAFDTVSGAVGGPHITPPQPLAAGGRIPGYGGGDILPALLEPGETVIDKDRSRALAPLFRALGVPGFQGGGQLMPGRAGALGATTLSGGPSLGGLFRGLLHGVGNAGKILAALFTGNTTALFNALMAEIPHGVGGAVGDLAKLLIDIPKTLLTDAVHWLISHVVPSGGALGAGGAAGGSEFANLMIVARYLMAHGANRAAAAGIAGTVAGESGGSPEAVGTGGAGLIGWTPPGSAYPILPLVTGNAGRDMMVQLVDMMAYIAANGGLGRLNAAGSPMSVAWLFSRAYERPLVTGSDIRPGVVAQVYSALDAGGWIMPGATVALNNTGMREAVLNPRESQAYTQLARAAVALLDGTSGGGRGKTQVAETVNIMTPEGASVAQMFSELVFRLRAAEVAGNAAVRFPLA